MNEAIKNGQMQTCPQCGNHCPADALQCGKGRKCFGVAEAGRGHHGHDGEHRHHRHEGRGR